eukprot:11996106-Alexandrium_andersonii.AAC.1
MPASPATRSASLVPSSPKALEGQQLSVNSNRRRISWHADVAREGVDHWGPAGGGPPSAFGAATPAEG